MARRAVYIYVCILRLGCYPRCCSLFSVVNIFLRWHFLIKLSWYHKYTRSQLILSGKVATLISSWSIKVSIAAQKFTTSCITDCKGSDTKTQINKQTRDLYVVCSGQIHLHQISFSPDLLRTLNKRYFIGRPTFILSFIKVEPGSVTEIELWAEHVIKQPFVAYKLSPGVEPHG